MTAFFSCAQALIGGAFVSDIRLSVRHGRIASICVGEAPHADDVHLETLVPGFANAHSHAFHRALRGRTHADGGDFWRWRDEMYAIAGSLTPESLRILAEQTFTEMRDAGYTAVGEFHYVHHQVDGTAYPEHAMEVAVAEAAVAAGIRLVLLDACYLRGGIGQPLDARQRRFGDRDVHAWLERREALQSRIGADPRLRDLVTVGAAVHSVRAIEPDSLAVIARELPADVPLHLHLSEQPAENTACRSAYGLTPTGLLAEHGLLRPTTSAVHATHLTVDDIRLLGESGLTVVMCPTTEADLGDGIGPAAALRDAGSALAIGSDQHVVIDPWEETARLEFDQRLLLQRRGVLSPAELWTAGGGAGYHSLGLAGAARATPGFAIGDLFDAVEISLDTPRTRGIDPLQLPLVARESDVTATIVGGTLTRPQPREVSTCAR